MSVNTAAEKRLRRLEKYLAREMAKAEEKLAAESRTTSHVFSHYSARKATLKEIEGMLR